MEKRCKAKGDKNAGVLDGSAGQDSLFLCPSVAEPITAALSDQGTPRNFCSAAGTYISLLRLPSQNTTGRVVSTTECIFSWFWRLEVQNQGAPRVGFC